MIWFKLIEADTFMFYLAKVKVEKSERRRFWSRITDLGIISFLY